MARRLARVRVLVADDHPVFLEGLVRALRERPEMDVVASVGTGREALAAIRETVPDVAVLDLALPELTGLEIVKAVRRDGGSTRMMILSAFHDDAVVHDALAAGALGYLIKTASRDEVCNGITRIMRGRHAVAPELEEALLRELQRQNSGYAPLTQREQQVLALAADGLTSGEIAQRLHVATTTVKSHFDGIYDKLGVRQRTAAVATALRENLLD